MAELRVEAGPAPTSAAASTVTTLAVVIECAPPLARKARYVLDTLLLAAGLVPRYGEQPPASGPWLLYAPSKRPGAARDRCVAVAHCPPAWRVFDGERGDEQAHFSEGLHTVFPMRAQGFDGPSDIGFDLVANAFYFLSSFSERSARAPGAAGRQLYTHSVFARLNIPQDVVDRYLAHLMARIRAVYERIGAPAWTLLAWPGGASHAVVLSHDVDFLPSGPMDIARQGAKTVLRHLVRQRDPADAWRAALGCISALAAGRDPYGCVPEIIARERAMGVRSSFQVAVGHRHANDVNYFIEDDGVRDYLRAITIAGFDLCLHGSYRSTENQQWYVDEARLLERCLKRPLGSRQHYLAFDYDALFSAQEAAGIEYDMSMGFPDHPGPRAGFSHPYFPYHLGEDRPYKVLQISLFLMDVTLRGYLGLRPAGARRVIGEHLEALRRARGCVSVVWHPIVFGGARDPGYGELYFELAARVLASGGVATDGRTINRFWRDKAAHCTSFQFE